MHQLILETFDSCRPNRHVCCHANGNKLDNRIENLRWDTRKNNELDKIEHGTANRGEHHNQAKLNTLQVRIIRRLLNSGGFNQREIAALFKVHFSTINKIAKNVNWVAIL